MESYFHINIPVQMISCTDTTGKITPLHFKFKDKSGEIISVKVNQILRHTQDSTLMGASFDCNAIIYNEMRLFTLHYNYAHHEWCLSKANITH